jgi:hypothetical protein
MVCALFVHQADTQQLRRQLASTAPLVSFLSVVGLLVKNALCIRSRMSAVVQRVKIVQTKLELLMELDLRLAKFRYVMRKHFLSLMLNRIYTTGLTIPRQLSFKRTRSALAAFMVQG